ncbi:type II secretion system F family protein [Brevirhabdus sp.]|uniref:type II secretion system F family protein n=1 Tax=Brevirhabdus sp. TaxID=2004514 RepID=UPI004058F810
MKILNQINQMLVEQLGEMGPLIAVGGLGAVLVVVAIPAFLRPNNDPLSRLKESTKAHRDAAPAPGKADQKALRSKRNPNSEKLDRFSGFLEPQNAEEYSANRLKLLQAGYSSRSAVQTYHFMQFALGIGFLILGVLYAIITGDMTTKKMVLSVLVPGGAGYMLPRYWVNSRRKKRQEEIVSGFPDALDLMLVCVEAGQSLDQAIIRVAKEIRAGFPALADELEIVSYEVKAGKDKVSVLKDMGERCGVADVSSFVTVLIQSAAFGTSIAEALRVYAEEMRDKRVMRAEEKANVLPTKLTLGTMMFTVPPLMIILIGPSIYEIVQTLGGGVGK